uniref:Flavonoid 3',5'-hydroxylase n=1 Tax=Lobelia erinus TaxID=16430 RepID=A4F1T9_LOBER|nr:flavonoid 3',5'-hydroxylase [Lobelia erinus]
MDATNIASMILFHELSAAILLFMVTHLFIRFLIKASGHHDHQLQLPPGPRGWPIIGALPLLGSMPHVALASMARKYGPVMYLKLGSSGMVVASNPEAARAFLKTLDTNFRNRPLEGGPTHLAYNAQDMVFANYGPKWQLLRKLCNLHMLGAKALDDWAHVRIMEVGHMLQAMYDQCSSSSSSSSTSTGPAGPVAVVLPEMLTYALANMLGQVIFSKRAFVASKSDATTSTSSTLKSAGEFQHMVMELMRVAGLFNIGDFIPSIAWMDLQGIQRDMKTVHKKFDELLTRMIREHTESAQERKGNPDFLDILMALATATNQEKNTATGEEQQLSVTNIKALILDLVTAGTDTSLSIIEWALAEMMNKPSILKRAQEEMDQVVGRNRRLEESDIPRLPYLGAICKETFRKHPSTPLSLPRVSSEACQVDGYYVPKNTRLMVNIWAIGRDPNVWENPLDFNPDRFLTSSGDVIDPRGNHFELIPFGAGRRICAGTRMGIGMVEYILGTLVHSFDWKVAAAEAAINVDMEESFGIALQKKVPLSAILSPRLPPSAYSPS